MEARALVSRRTRPLTLDGGRTVHQVAHSVPLGLRRTVEGRDRQRSARHQRRAERDHHGIQGAVVHDHARQDAAGRGGAGVPGKNLPARGPRGGTSRAASAGYHYKGKIGSEHGQQGQPQ